MKYDKVVSLGPSCETAYQIRQLVHQEEAYPFDWVIASSNSVARAIATDFKEMLKAPHLRLTRRNGQTFIMDELTRIEFHHDFVNDETFMNGLPNAQQKYEFICDRTRNLLRSNSSVLFVHHCGSREDAIHIDAALAEYFPSLKYSVLELTCGEERSPEREGRIIYASIAGYGTKWQERTTQWSDIFDRLLASSFQGAIKRRDPTTWDKIPD